MPEELVKPCAQDAPDDGSGDGHQVHGRTANRGAGAEDGQFETTVGGLFPVRIIGEPDDEASDYTAQDLRNV